MDNKDKFNSRYKSPGCNDVNVPFSHMADHYKQCHPLLALPELLRVSDTKKDTIEMNETK